MLFEYFFPLRSRVFSFISTATASSHFSMAEYNIEILFFAFFFCSFFSCCCCGDYSHRYCNCSCRGNFILESHQMQCHEMWRNQILNGIPAHTFFFYYFCPVGCTMYLLHLFIFRSRKKKLRKKKKRMLECTVQRYIMPQVGSPIRIKIFLFPFTLHVESCL